MPRTQIMSAVAAKIQGMTFASPVNSVSTWRTFSQKLRLWADVPVDQQPAAFLVSHSETAEYLHLGVVRRRLNLAVWCYSRSDNSVGQTDLDILLESFEALFGPGGFDNPLQNTLTLNNLVYWIRIQGKVVKDPGDVDGQTLLIVPLVAEVP